MLTGCAPAPPDIMETTEALEGGPSASDLGLGALYDPRQVSWPPDNSAPINEDNINFTEWM